MNQFSHENVPIEDLKKKAYNYRWATVPEGVIPLTAADPDFQIAPVIRAAINKYTNAGVFSYGPAEGLPEFRTAIANWYKTTKNVEYTSNQILPVNSAAYALFLTATTLLQAEDEAIILSPVDFLFRKSIEHAGAVLKESELDKTTGSINRAELIQLVSKKTKVIYICNPNNPLGKTMNQSDLRWLEEFVIDNDLWVISDEIWADIVYDDSFQSIASLSESIKDRTVVISGLSKNFGLAGLRIGYLCVSNETLFTKIFKQSKFETTAYGIPTLSQVAGTAALNEGKDWLADFKLHLEKMKTLVHNFAEASPLFEAVSTNATYIYFPKIANQNISSEAFCKIILEYGKVAIVPGGKNWFEAPSEGHVRFCFSTSETILQTAFENINKATDQIIVAINKATATHFSQMTSI